MGVIQSFNEKAMKLMVDALIASSTKLLSFFFFPTDFEPMLMYGNS